MTDTREPAGQHCRKGGEERKEHGAPVRGPPARRFGQRWNDHQREAAARHRRSAVESLRRRAAARGSDEVEPGDECGSGSDADDRAADQRELEAAVHEQQAVPEDRGRDRTERDSLRAEAIGPTPGRKLHGEMGDEQRRRQQADCGQRDAVVLRERICDRADVRDVPRQATADREPCDDPVPGRRQAFGSVLGGFPVSGRRR